MDRRRLRPAHDVERDGLMGVAAETTDLQIEVARIEGIPECRRWLRRSLEASIRLVQASQASLSASRRASAARSAATRTEVA